MDKIAEAIQKLIEAGGPLASKGMALWAWVRILDVIAGVVECLIFAVGTYAITRVILKYCRWYVTTENEAHRR